MRYRTRRTHAKWILGTAAVLAIAVGLVLHPSTEAQDRPLAEGPSIAPNAGTEIAVPEVRTIADMQAAAAASGVVSRARRVKPLMPTVSPAEYAARKSAAAASRSAAVAPEAVRGPLATAPTLRFTNFEGLNGAEGGGFAPSDSIGAAGQIQYVEAVNEALRVWNKGTDSVQPSVLGTFSLPTFFNTADSVFDPRVIYDPFWQRFIVVATRHSDSATDTVRRIFLAVSRTNSAVGPWCKYNVSFSGGSFQNGDWWDYPQLGRDSDGLIITGNVFTGTDQFRTAAVISISKAQAYNCIALTPSVFQVSGESLAPPLVNDITGSAYLLSATAGTVVKFALTGSGRNPGAALTGPTPIAGVAGWTVPPNARQPSTTTVLDTLDGRFQNVSTQIGSHVWNIHAVDGGGFARLRWYRVNGVSNAVLATGTVTPASSTEDDFNPSIAASNTQAVFVAYSASSAATRAQIRFTGKLLSEVTIPAGTTLLTSPASFTGVAVARWGDYSSVSMDPALGTRAWIVNQYAAGTDQFDWATRIARIGN